MIFVIFLTPALFSSDTKNKPNPDLAAQNCRFLNQFTIFLNQVGIFDNCTACGACDKYQVSIEREIKIHFDRFDHFTPHPEDMSCLFHSITKYLDIDKKRKKEKILISYSPLLVSHHPPSFAKSFGRLIS